MLGKRIQKVEFDLPLQFSFETTSFYERECYSEYYHYVTSLLNTYNFISVTGTPGIGKSIFYIYFFQRYRKQNPSATIITASFGKNRNLEKCIVYTADALEGKKHKEIPAIEGAIHWYDGAPKIKPPDNKMVCFTSPDHSWFDYIFNENKHTELYMPVWTLEELIEAKDLLDLPFENNEIQTRFERFRGCARYCLAISDLKYEKAVEKLNSRIRSIQTFADFRDCLYGEHSHQHFTHLLFHQVPVLYEGIPHNYVLDFCSPDVRKEIEYSIRDERFDQRRDFANRLHGQPAVVRILRWLYIKVNYRMSENN